MCGIFGMVGVANGHFDCDWTGRAVRTLMRASEVRGKEATGLAVHTPSDIRVFKQAGRAKYVARSLPLRRFLDDALNALQTGNDGKFQSPLVFLGHSRLVTNGYRSLDDNNQPIITESCVGIHNGIVVNDEELWLKHPLITRSSEVDSEVIFRLIDLGVRNGLPVQQAISSAFSEINGVANIAFVRRDTRTLELATNNGSLYLFTSAQKNCVIFASERYLLAKALTWIGFNASANELRHLRPGEGASLSYDDASVSYYKLGVPDVAVLPQAEPNGMPIIWRRASKATLRRCTRCILPETFPGISFDEKGVCSVCREHEVKVLHGEAELERIVAPYRSKTGEADCIIAFSGGRDSSYGLHYLKRELGLNPIAYTYDWGMVTDVARRNISRLCGRLGVEHLLRSPDIPKKRRYIRRNIEAWLKQPDLGMIPLFMAGDKQFYHYGRRVGRETGIPLIIFCAGNELERTEFKSGFSGVRESKHGQVLFRYSIWNKVRLLAYYVTQCVKNPSYLNSSLLDTLSAFYSTYIERDDFLYLYHYIPWDEQLIAKTLQDEYGWESAPETSNSWRIGDGTAAFYNYIYDTMAGFSEHDTFRSNQVRANIVDRSEALRLAEIDNQPRWRSMQEYADLVGFNLEEALVVINGAPKLYN
jgi:glucosamine--fructose-6-phosphate aminotransferase (isomerizing)